MNDAHKLIIFVTQFGKSYSISSLTWAYNKWNFTASSIYKYVWSIIKLMTTVTHKEHISRSINQFQFWQIHF